MTGRPGHGRRLEPAATALSQPLLPIPPQGGPPHGRAHNYPGRPRSHSPRGRHFTRAGGGCWLGRCVGGWRSRRGSSLVRGAVSQHYEPALSGASLTGHSLLALAGREPVRELVRAGAAGRCGGARAPAARRRPPPLLRRPVHRERGGECRQPLDGRARRAGRRARGEVGRRGGRDEAPLEPHGQRVLLRAASAALDPLEPRAGRLEAAREAVELRLVRPTTLVVDVAQALGEHRDSVRDGEGGAGARDHGRRRRRLLDCHI
mmetsp:Transcript_13166/g.39760  ORF Transcript_13166/g.39760 Transcript_13166/m.39760 type:complete len:262 (+) Transcript_13166:77-862(+)